jgi:hypothetical protein
MLQEHLKSTGQSHDLTKSRDNGDAREAMRMKGRTMLSADKRNRAVQSNGKRSLDRHSIR